MLIKSFEPFKDNVSILFARHFFIVKSRNLLFVKDKNDMKKEEINPRIFKTAFLIELQSLDISIDVKVAQDTDKTK